MAAPSTYPILTLRVAGAIHALEPGQDRARCGRQNPDGSGHGAGTVNVLTCQRCVDRVDALAESTARWARMLGMPILPELRAAIRATLVAQANAQNARWPQYQDYWDSADWEVRQVTVNVTTKMGIAFERGDFVLADMRPTTFPFNRRVFAVAYSWRNAVNTSLPANVLV